MVLRVFRLARYDRFLFSLTLFPKELGGVNILFWVPSLNSYSDVLLEFTFLNEVDVLEIVSHVEDNTPFDAFNWLKRTTNSKLCIFIDRFEFRNFPQELMSFRGFSFLLLLNYFTDIFAIQSEDEWVLNGYSTIESFLSIFEIFTAYLSQRAASFNRTKHVFKQVVIILLISP